MRRLFQTWAPKFLLTFTEQGLFSSANFLFSVLLARWLSAADYGEFSVVQSLILVFFGINQSLILEPMIVIGPARYSHALARYGATLRWLYLLCSSLGAVSFLLIGPALVGDVRATVYFTAALLTPAILHIWLLRLLPYLEGRPHKALVPTSVYAVLLLSGTIVLRYSDRLSVETAFTTLAVSTIAAAVFTFVFFSAFGRKHSHLALPKESPIRVGTVAREHWFYGKWALAASILSIGGSQIQTIVAGSLLGLEAAGILRALMNFILPMSQILMASGFIVIPAVARDYANGNLFAVTRKTRLFTLVATAMAAGYGILLWAFGNPIEALVFGGKYADHTGLIVLLAFYPVISALSLGWGAKLRAMQKAQHHLVLTLVSGPVGIVSAIVMIPLWGLNGAVFSMLLTAGAGAFVLFLLCRLWYRP